MFLSDCMRQQTCISHHSNKVPKMWCTVLSGQKKMRNYGGGGHVGKYWRAAGQTTWCHSMRHNRWLTAMPQPGEAQRLLSCVCSGAHQRRSGHLADRGGLPQRANTKNKPPKSTTDPKGLWVTNSCWAAIKSTDYITLQISQTIWILSVKRRTWWND